MLSSTSCRIVVQKELRYADPIFAVSGERPLTLILLTWRIWWAANNASIWQMELNSAFKGLNLWQDKSRVTLRDIAN